MSIESPYITASPAQQLALIHVTVARSEIMSAMGPALNELGSVLKAQGIAPTGPWFAHHLHRPTDTFDFNVCSPIAQPIEPTGRVTNGQLAAAEVARTVYSGPYDGLPAAWAEFIAWTEANNHRTRTDLWEVYLVDPKTSPDPAQWRTELNAPLVLPTRN